jgi:hypothetical protein
MDLSLRRESFLVDDQSWLGSEHGTQATESITLDTSAFTANTHYPDGFFKSGIPLAKLASGLYGPYVPDSSEVQTVTITGTPTGGSFTLTWSGQTTAAIAYNATAATVKTALEALSNINVGDVITAGGPFPGTAVTVTFTGQYAGVNVAQMTSTDSLTGGSSPASAVTTTTAGGTDGGTGGTLDGFLYAAVKAPAVNTTDVTGALFVHGKVRMSRLPLGVIDAGGIANVAGRIRFI